MSFNIFLLRSHVSDTKMASGPSWYRSLKESSDKAWNEHIFGMVWYGMVWYGRVFKYGGYEGTVGQNPGAQYTN